MGRAISRNVVAHSCDKQRPEHVGEGGQEQAAAPKSIDCPDGGPGEKEVYQAEAERGDKGFFVRSATFSEDCRAVEGYDVYTAHLLRNHNYTRSLRCAAYTGDSKEFDEAGEEVGLWVDACLADQNFFLLEQAVRVVEVAGSLERRVAETQERIVGLGVFALFHEPAGALRDEVDAQDEGHGGDESRAELQTPRYGPCVLGFMLVKVTHRTKIRRRLTMTTRLATVPRKMPKAVQI